jgi:hypothetical protein
LKIPAVASLLTGKGFHPLKTRPFKFSTGREVFRLPALWVFNGRETRSVKQLWAKTEGREGENQPKGCFKSTEFFTRPCFSLLEKRQPVENPKGRGVVSPRF